MNAWAQWLQLKTHGPWEEYLRFQRLFPEEHLCNQTLFENCAKSQLALFWDRKHHGL